MAALGTVADLELRMKREFTSDGDIAEAESALDEASEIVRTEGSALWVDAAEVPRIVRLVVLRLAGRKISNPDGYSSETAGDYSFQRNGVGADGALALTSWESRVIRRAAGRNLLWTLPTTRLGSWWSR
jgi:hypothetical protein